MLSKWFYTTFRLNMLLLGIALLSSGCLPFAWMTPPMKVSSGFGGSITIRSSPSANAEQDDIAPKKPGAMNLYFGLFPLKAHPSMELRPFDFGIGYHISQFYGGEDQGIVIHGPYLEMSWYPHTRPLHRKSLWNSRFGVHLQPRLLMITDSGYRKYGIATNIKFTAELSRYLEPNSGGNCDNDGCVFGSWFGEISIGIFAQTGYGFLGKTHFVDIRAGVFLNIPISVGAGFIFLKR